jgi:hypothetical protein
VGHGFATGASSAPSVQGRGCSTEFADTRPAIADPYSAEAAEEAARLRRDIDSYGALIQANMN